MHLFTFAVKRILILALILGSGSFAMAQKRRSAREATADSIADVTRSNRKKDNLKSAAAADSARAFSKKVDKRQKLNGTVIDPSTKKPIAGINISVPDYSAAITDEKGAFQISVPDYKGTILISGPNYQTKEVALHGKNTVTVMLYESSYPTVYAPVTLPFSSQLSNHVTGAVEAVAVNDRWQRANESADSYLQGRITGLNVIRKSGTPGVGANMFLRGFNSLYSNNQPAIYVDGILYDNNDYGISLIGGHVGNPLANIDIKDIDNITVVKDATAASFGTKAANGVILIGTSRSKDQATAIDFSAYGGYNIKPSQMPVMQASDYRIYLSELLKSAGVSDAVIQAQPYMNDNTNPAINPNYYRYHYNTDWQKEVTQNSYNQNYYLKITGGDNIATYGLSVGYLNNSGITKNTDLQRYQTRFNADLNLSNRLKGNANLSFVSNEQNLKDQGIANKTNPIYLSLTKSPFLSVQDVADDGAESPNFAGTDIFNVSNPSAVIDKMQAINKNYRFLGSVGFDYMINKQFALKVLGGVTFDKVRENIFIPQKGIAPDTVFASTVSNRSGSNVERLYSVFSDLRGTYSKTFNNTHALVANLGFRYNSNNMESDYGYGYNSATDDYVSVSNGQALLRRIGGTNGKWNSINAYTNVDYSFRSKYFAAFTMAVDGSSRFGKTASAPLTINGNKLAVLPAVSAGWLISSEDFMANSKVIESLKLRASYGLVGNDDIGNYSARQYYVAQSFLGAQGLVRGNVANTSLKWETVTKLNGGIDASLFKERLSISFDVFHNETKDMIVFEPITGISGFNYALSNNGGMRTNGIELGVNGRILNKSVKWDMGITISKSRNEITQVPNGRIVTQYAGGNILTQTGMSANLFYGYKTNGVYTTDAEAAASGLSSRNADGTVVAFKGGDMRFVNTNGDAFIDQNDMQVIGDPTPDFTGMISNGLTWRRLSFDAIITFSSGNDLYNYTRRGIESMGGFQNQTLAALSRWKSNGQVTNMPRVQYADPAGNSRFSDRWIEDGSYLRLRTLSVTYDVPFKAKGFKYAKVYLTGNNIFTATKYLGFDPEFNAGTSVFSQGTDIGLEPQFRTIQVGLKVGL